MENNKIHSVVGLFSTPDSIIHAARKVADSGFKRWDVNTPYPVHGLDKAMKLKPSGMGYFALAFGLAGTLTAILMMTFMSVIDYQMNIGGKPAFALPAFIPITFELTVLFAVIGTVVGLLFVFFRFPDNSHPLHDSAYMKRCTADSYGICLEAADARFDEAAAKEMLSQLGASDINTIYFDKEEAPKIFTKPFIIFLLSAAVICSGAGYFVTNKLMFMAPFNWMENQGRLDVHELNSFFANGSGMREPVPGTVPRDYMPEEFQASPDSAGAFLLNPVEASTKIIESGKSKFLIYCSPCHGNYAKGDSRLRGLFPNPPTLHSKKVRNWTDGRIYHVITFGQGAMPSYSKQLSRDERWAVINYLRTLQRAFNPKEEDFNESK